MDKMRKISIIWGALLAAIFAALTLFSLNWKNNTSKYKDLEKMIKLKTEGYFESAHSYPAVNSSIKITLQELKDANVITEFKVEDDACDGYVIVEATEVNKFEIINYKPYIKCQNYTTKGY